MISAIEKKYEREVKGFQCNCRHMGVISYMITKAKIYRKALRINWRNNYD